MVYTVADISEKLGYSKVTIYNKINSLKTTLNDCITHKQGVMYLNNKGLLIIKEDLGLKNLNDKDNSKDIKPDENEGSNRFKDFKEIDYLLKTVKTATEEGQKEYIKSLLNHIENLKTELDKKDGQLNNKDDQLNNTLKLLENSQVLLKDNQEKIFMLETREESKKWYDVFKRKK